MNLLQFYVNHERRECSVMLGLPFAFSPLRDLPASKDGKETFILGMQPHTIEKRISIPFSYHMDAYNVCNFYSNNTEEMIHRLEELSKK